MKKFLYAKKLELVIMICIFIILCLFIKINPSMILNYTSTISGILTISSISVGFLFSCFTVIPNIMDKNTWNKLKGRKTTLRLMNLLLFSIMLFLFSVILGILCLVCFSSNSKSSTSVFLISGLFSVLIGAIFELIYVITIIIHTIDTNNR